MKNSKPTALNLGNWFARMEWYCQKDLEEWTWHHICHKSPHPTKDAYTSTQIPLLSPFHPHRLLSVLLEWLQRRIAEETFFIYQIIGSKWKLGKWEFRQLRQEYRPLKSKDRQEYRPLKTVNNRTDVIWHNKIEFGGRKHNVWIARNTVLVQDIKGSMPPVSIFALVKLLAINIRRYTVLPRC